MTAVSEAFTQCAFRKHGNECLSKGKGVIRERLPTLQDVFIKCYAEIAIDQSPDGSKVPDSCKKEMVEFIVERSANAFYGFEEKMFGEIHTGRKGTDHTANNFRTHLKSICTDGVVADKEALAKAEVGIYDINEEIPNALSSSLFEKSISSNGVLVAVSGLSNEAILNRIYDE
jgi:hypothetical protein